MTMHRAKFAAVGLLVALAGWAAPACSQQMAVELDPAHSRVDFTLDAVMHTVHGDFHLKNGTLVFDRQNGAASGQLTVDATSGESGNQGRDRKMHKVVLESAKYPDIVFQPQHVIGKLPAAGATQVQIEGVMSIHGQAHPVMAKGPVQVDGERVSAELHFIVPYQQWGMKNPSTLFLRVSDKVEITVHAVGRLSTAAASTAAQAGAAATH